jgi:hypothetical protein
MLAFVVAALTVGSGYGKNIVSAQWLTISEPSNAKTQMENRTLQQQKDAMELLLIYCDQQGHENKTDAIQDLIHNGFLNAQTVGNSCDSAKQSYDNVVNKITDIQIKMQKEIK